MACHVSRHISISFTDSTTSQFHAIASGEIIRQWPPAVTTWGSRKTCSPSWKRKRSRAGTPDELAVETLRAGLRQQSWQAKAARWQEYGKASGYTADDVPDVVRQWRNEQHGR
jgi:hypothetical protein